MKQSIIFFIVVALLSSCIGSPAIPAPRDQESSLVIGSLIVDFPDGFFQHSRRIFDNRVKIYVTNTTKGTDHTLYTTYGGYFYFCANPKDSYLIKSFEIGDIMVDSGTYTIGARPLGQIVAPEPNRIIYLGHATFSYTMPQFSDVLIRHGQNLHTWNYRISLSHAWKQDELKQFLAKQQTAQPWTSYVMVEYGKK